MKMKIIFLAVHTFAILNLNSAIGISDFARTFNRILSKRFHKFKESLFSKRHVWRFKINIRRSQIFNKNLKEIKSSYRYTVLER